MSDAGAERVHLELTDDERAVLRAGLLDWGGPARVTPQMAVAMGFRDEADLFSEGDRLRRALAAGEPMTRFDWTRTVLATEIVFVSDAIGSGLDWISTSGFSDAETIAILRSVQRTMLRAGIWDLHTEP